MTRLVHSYSLPNEALLHKYHSMQGAYTDCYAIDVPISISHANYVNMFYTTWLFKLERFILTWTVSKPSTDEQAKEVANGLRENFAAWTVEARAENQLLMCDFMSRTRSWFMTVPLETGGTRLYFGSAVVPPKDKTKLDFIVLALLGFHKLYSFALLYSAQMKISSSFNEQEILKSR